MQQYLLLFSVGIITFHLGLSGAEGNRLRAMMRSGRTIEETPVASPAETAAVQKSRKPNPERLKRLLAELERTLSEYLRSGEELKKPSAEELTKRARAPLNMMRLG